MEPGKPEVLAKMSTTSNNEGIRLVRWLGEDMISFVGEDGNKPPQVYLLNLKTRHLEQRTAHISGVVNYRMSAQGLQVVFLGDARAGENCDRKSGTEIIVTSQRLDDLLECKDGSRAPLDLFSQTRGSLEVRLPGHTLAIVGDPEPVSEKQNREMDTPVLDVMIEENINSPQKICVRDPKTERKAVLLELNPQFANLRFAKVELVNWKASDGNDILNGGGLYLPPDYEAGKKYPLVIQTHHFQKDIFMIDGAWGSGYAAQALAAKGFVVLQVHHAKGYYDHKPNEAAAEMGMYEGAIDYLDGRGLVDRNRVGIFAFSRTVYHVAYALTHSKYPFAAAILEDGVDGGYLQYLGYPPDGEEEAIYGGPAWGAAQATWTRDAPGFNLDKVRTPIHIMEHGRYGALEQWEWFSGLRLLHKPVDMVILSNPGSGEHLLKKPSEMMISQQGTVDWFCFWLKGEEDPELSKADQYDRWRELRKLQQDSDKGSGK